MHECMYYVQTYYTDVHDVCVHVGLLAPAEPAIDLR